MCVCMINSNRSAVIPMVIVHSSSVSVPSTDMTMDPPELEELEDEEDEGDSELDSCTDCDESHDSRPLIGSLSRAILEKYVSSLAARIIS